MAGRAAAPLPRSARSQPPALRAPLSPLLSPALGGGGSSLLVSLAPVIRGAGLGGRFPRPPPAAPRWGAPREPRAQTPPTQSHKPRHRGGGPDPTTRTRVRRLRGEGSLPPTGSQPAVAHRRVPYVC